MAEGAEKKYLSELDFKIDSGLKNLDVLLTKLDDVAKKSEEISTKISKNMSGTIGGVKIGEVSNKVKAEYVAIEKNAQKHANKLAEIDAAKNAKIEIQNNQLNNKILLKEKEHQAQLAQAVESGTKSRIAEYAKTYVIYQGFNQLKEAALDTVEAIKKVEFRMMEIARIMEDGSIVIDDYRDSLLKLAYDYGRTFEEVSSTTLNFARAGYDANDALALTEKSLLALNTAELDAEQATDGLISIMAQWGMDMGTTEEKAANLGSIIDKVNKVADNFPISSEGLLEALKRTSQGFNLAGASIDETIAMIVAAERASQRGGKVIGTAMANMAQQLKTDTRIDLAENLGIKIYVDEARTEFNNITEIFAQLSEKMVELQENGKSSSEEMQNLLEVFTVFRRNVGAGLLSEMSGDDSTYVKALETSLDSLGYSAQENSKYMGTMEAATKQLENTILELQTTIGDKGGKDLFSAFILGAQSGLNAIDQLIDKFGLIPVAVATATLAMAAFNKNMRFSNVKNAIYELKEINLMIKTFNTYQKEGSMSAKEFNDTIGKHTTESFKKYVAGLKSSQGSIGGYIVKTVAAKAAQIALNIAVAAGEAALTFGLSLAIQAVVELIGNWVNATEKAGEAVGEMNDQLNESKSSLQEYVTEFESLRSAMEDENLTVEEKNAKKQELIKIEQELIKLYGDEAKNIDLVTGSINEQSEAIENLAKTDYRKYVQENKKEIDKLAKQFSEIGTESFTTEGFWDVYSSEFYDYIEQVTKEVDGLTGVVGNAGNIIRIESEGTTSQIMSQYRELYDKVAQYSETASGAQADDANAFLERLSNTIKDLDEEYGESLKEYEEYLSNRLAYDNFYFEVYGKLLKSRAELDKAVLSGNPEQIKQAQENLSKVYETAISRAKEDEVFGSGIIEMLEKDLEEAQDYANLNTIKATLEIDSDKNGKKLKEEIQDTLNAMGEITITDLKTAFDSGEITDGMKELQEEIESAGYTVDDFINNFDKLGLTLGESNQKVVETKDNMKALKESVVESLDDLTQLENGFATVYQAMSDFNENGYISASTLQNLINNDLLQYFDVVNGKLSINEAAMANAATAAKVKAANDLAAKAAAEIMAIAEADAAKQADGAASSASNLSANSQALAGAMLTVGRDGSAAAVGIKEFWAALKDKTGVDAAGLSKAAQNQINSVVKNFQSSITALNSINVKAASYSRVSAKSSGGGGSKKSTKSSSSASNSDAAKEAEEARKAIIDAFKEMIEERERLEDRWVKNKKAFGLISEKDELYILQQSIKRYKKYADEVNKLTMATEEEKIELRKKYLEEAEDLEVEYFELLRDLADDRIDAIEDKYDDDVDAYEDAIDKKIDKINEWADAQIAALDKVEEENDRIRQKEEYEARRKELIHGNQGIEYWEQRTGREAQLALAEVRKELDELDKDWEETQKQWNTEDKIAEIEAKRDAEIEALEAEKSKYLENLEEMKNAEIEAIESKYKYELEYFNSTGQIILENASIQSQEMFNLYKKNFIDPVGTELKNALSNDTQKTTAAKKSNPATINYTIKSGDTLWGIARRYNTTIAKIMDANPYITNANKIYAGKKLKIPKSHTGSRIIKDGLVELQAGETVLNMDWAKGLDKMLGNFNKNSSSDSSVINNGNTLNVKGDLIKVEAKIDDKSDAAYFSRRMVRELENKFNIKK